MAATSTDTRGRVPPPGVRAGALAAVAGAITLAVVHAVHGLSYWNYSEGVYALTSHLWLHGGDLYGHIVAAQPPGTFLAGTAVLGLHDSLGWLRVGIGAFQLAAGLLSARVVWRLTASTWAAAAAPVLTLLTPWAVHEHGALTPELVALPLLLGAVLLAARERTAGAGGAVAALLPFVKVPFLLPAAAIVLLSANRRRALLWGLVTLVAEVLLTLLIFGGGVWRDTVVAQLHTGSRTSALHLLFGIWGQGAWNIAGLVVAAGVAVSLRTRLRDDVLLRVLVGTAIALVLTIATTVKVGTGLNVLVPVEAVLVPLALTALAAGGQRRGMVLAVAGILFTLAQTASLLAAPHQTHVPFLYPSSKTGSWGRLQSDASMRETRARIRAACPAGRPYPGPPIVALLAGRPVPDDQPDGFLTSRAPSLRAVAAARAAVQPVCAP